VSKGSGGAEEVADNGVQGIVDISLEQPAAKSFELSMHVSPRFKVPTFLTFVPLTLPGDLVDKHSRKTICETMSESQRKHLDGNMLGSEESQEEVGQKINDIPRVALLLNSNLWGQTGTQKPMWVGIPKWDFADTSTTWGCISSRGVVSAQLLVGTVRACVCVSKVSLRWT